MLFTKSFVRGFPWPRGKSLINVIGRVMDGRGLYRGKDHTHGVLVHYKSMTCLSIGRTQTQAPSSYLAFLYKQLLRHRTFIVMSLSLSHTHCQQSTPSHPHERVQDETKPALSPTMSIVKNARFWWAVIASWSVDCSFAVSPFCFILFIIYLVLIATVLIPPQTNKQTNKP